MSIGKRQQPGFDRLWILLIALPLLNRLRGMDTPKWLPLSTRIVAALVVGGMVWLVSRDGVYAAIWATGWFTWAVGSWWPHTNWSASGPVDWKFWVYGDLRHSLYSLALFSMIFVYTAIPLPLMLVPLALVGFMPFWYWLFGQKLKKTQHTVWAEFFVGFHWFVIYAVIEVLIFCAKMYG